MKPQCRSGLCHISIMCLPPALIIYCSTLFMHLISKNSSFKRLAYDWSQLFIAQKGKTLISSWAELRLLFCSVLHDSSCKTSPRGYARVYAWSSSACLHCHCPLPLKGQACEGSMARQRSCESLCPISALAL